LLLKKFRNQKIPYLSLSSKTQVNISFPIMQELLFEKQSLQWRVSTFTEQ